MEQIEHREALSRTDFYIDMVGESARMSEEDYSNMTKALPQIIVGILVFGLTHTLGSKMGIFPPFFFFKKKESHF